MRVDEGGRGKIRRRGRRREGREEGRGRRERKGRNTYDVRKGKELLLLKVEKGKGSLLRDVVKSIHERRRECVGGLDSF